MKLMMRTNEKILSIPSISILLLIIFVVSCQTDVIESNNNEKETIEFRGKVIESEQIESRFTTSYVNSYLFDTNFYIELDTEIDGEDSTKFGIYHVPSGYEGRLNALDDNEPLMWLDLKSQHTFYGWTIPWNDDYTPSPEPVTVEFKNSSDSAGYKEYGNNKILEKFIGAKAGPYSYVENGKYVDFTFHHLVSKIKIGTFQLIESSGAVQKNLKADVTFIGMPTSATFYPHPENGDRPYVQIKEKNLDDGITYYIANDAVGSDVFYICPEINFDDINFQVKLKNEEYKNNNIDIYYGTFDDVKFERITGNDYDIGDGTDDKVLHAGEMMTLNITLIPGIGPGLSIVIDKWSTEDPRESQYHTYPGIYSDAEVKGLIDIFAEMSATNFCEKLAEIERLYELYGNDDDEEKIFYLYENVKYDSNIFPIYKEYILNGMGHIITMKSNSNSGVFSGSRYFNIGPARDVYLTDGENSIYIDEAGYVWVIDPATSTYKKTEHQLVPLEGFEKSYDISSVTGEIRKSNYFNNPLGEKQENFPSCN